MDSYAAIHSNSNNCANQYGARASSAPRGAALRASNDTPSILHENNRHYVNLEDKVLNLAKLLKTCQTFVEDSDAFHRQTELAISGRVKQLEGLMQAQFVGKAGGDLPAIKSLSDKIVALEQQLVEGLQENHYVHQHNAQVVVSMNERMSKLEHTLAQHNLNKLGDLSGLLDVPLMSGLQARVGALEGELQQLRAAQQQGTGAAGTRGGSSGSGHEEVDQRLARFETLLQHSVAQLAGMQQQATASPGGGGGGASLEAVEAMIDKKLAAWSLEVEAKCAAAAAQRVQDLQQAVERMKAESLTAREARHLIKYMQVVGGIHSSMQQGIAQLAAACPQISKNLDTLQASAAALAVAPAAAAAGAKSAAVAGVARDAQTALQVAQHAESVVSMLAAQLDKAVKLTAVAHRHFGGPADAPVAASQDEAQQQQQPVWRGVVDSSLEGIMQDAQQAVQQFMGQMRQLQQQVLPAAAAGASPDVMPVLDQPGRSNSAALTCSAAADDAKKLKQQQQQQQQQQQRDRSVSPRRAGAAAIASLPQQVLQLADAVAAAAAAEPSLRASTGGAMQEGSWQSSDSSDGNDIEADYEVAHSRGQRHAGAAAAAGSSRAARDEPARRSGGHMEARKLGNVHGVGASVDASGWAAGGVSKFKKNVRIKSPGPLGRAQQAAAGAAAAAAKATTKVRRKSMDVHGSSTMSEEALKRERRLRSLYKELQPLAW